MIEEDISNKMITVNMFSLEHKNIITIEDNAKGIPTTIINEIFDPYFTTKNEKGTGIGLYLAKIIIEEDMNGTLIVENTSFGAKFTILLPS